MFGGKGSGQMEALTIKDARKNLERIIERVIDDAEPAIFITEKGQQVVLLPLEEYNSWKETLYLMSTPANADHLRRSIREANTGKTFEHDLVDT
jgi:antitoxin YefM